jgi:hypothetical protein
MQVVQLILISFMVPLVIYAAVKAVIFAKQDRS